MNAIALKNIEKYYGVHQILSNVTLEINEGEKVALVGRNGSGKTTLLRVISGEHHEGGTRILRKRIRIGYLEQLAGTYPGLKGRDVLSFGNPALMEIRIQLTKMEKEMSAPMDATSLEQLLLRYGRLLERFENEGGYGHEARINEISEGLRIPTTSLENSFDVLSGGEKTKLLFAQMLVSEPELLLLDEPTNHLDLEALEWLEDYIRNYKGTVLLISHDRQFLDAAISRILELEDGECSSYNGNYSYYLKEKERRLLVDFENYQDQQKKIKDMEDAIKRLRDWGLRGDNEKFFRKAESIQKALDRMDRIKRPLLERRSVELNFEASDRSGKDVLFTKDLTLRIGERDLLHHAAFHLRFRESVGLMGPNGCGKTSFFRLITEELLPTEGELRIGANVKVGYLPQVVHFTHPERTILEEFRHSYPCNEGEARGILARYLFFKDSVFKRIKDLSGGEKTRLRLAELIHQDTNLLLLDEPTNHLDLETREALEDALSQFDGTLLFISHDRYFMRKMAERVYDMRSGKFIEI